MAMRDYITATTEEKKELQLNINTTGGGAGVSVYFQNIDVGYLHFVI